MRLRDYIQSTDLSRISVYPKERKWMQEVDEIGVKCRVTIGPAVPVANEPSREPILTKVYDTLTTVFSVGIFHSV